LGSRFIVSVWAVAIGVNDSVLLFRHTHDRAHPCGLPSGRVEGSETPEEALCREFHEEVGGMVSVRHLVAALREPELPALRLVYACDIESPPVVTSVEVDGWSYFAVDGFPPTIRHLQRVAIALARRQVDTSQWVIGTRTHGSTMHV
jgi:8-oxo-dGTP pyrophosphatase MutT (NUDIX family)